MAGVFEVKYETDFCAAHALRDYKGSTEPVHGHNFHVVVTVAGRKLDKAGMLVDFLDLKSAVDGEVAAMHYGFVNETVPAFRTRRGGGGLSPSAENMALVLFKGVAKKLPRGVKLASVEVFESPGCSATYRG
jgi:6-pyruvoyltetrahydropterin/6-carboxytetrahydropterin synthase